MNKSPWVVVFGIFLISYIGAMKAEGRNPTPTFTPTPCCQGVNETFTPLTQTEGLAVAGNQVYVTDGPDGGKVVKTFNLSGGTPVATLAPGPGGKAVECEGVAVDSFGDIYVADLTNTEVEEYSPTGTLLQQIALGGSLGNPRDVMIVTQVGTTSLFVSTWYAAYQYNSTSPTSTNSFPTSPNYTYPGNSSSALTGMVVANGGTTLYVADNGNGQVVSFPVGTSSSSPTTVLQNLSAPIGLATDEAGNFYLTYGVSVQRYSSNWQLEQTCSGLGAVWEDGLDAAGHIYVAQTAGGVTVLQNCVVEPTQTFTPTPTRSFTPTATSTSSSTPTPTDTPMFADMKPLGQAVEGGGSPTPTATPTITPTVSPIPPPALGSRTFQVVAAPNISKNGEPVQFEVTLGQASQVRLSLFCMTGEQVYQAIVQGTAGLNTISWNLQNLSGSPVASGLYIYRVEASDGSTVLNHVGKVGVIR